MPAKRFICPDSDEINMYECLLRCPKGTRCMLLPTLRAVASSLERNLKKPSVTELLSGTRELYLKRITEYAVDPQQQLYALHGSAVHTIIDKHTSGNMLSEERLKNNTTTGQFDVYGQILTTTDSTLGDVKVTSSYKLMKALGYYKRDVETSEVYKTGSKKGQRKTRKELFTDGVRHVLDWALQLNYYRLLLEEEGYPVSSMVIQALCRDASLRIAAERGITKPLYLIPIHPISNHWLRLYMDTKAKHLQRAIETGIVPKKCSNRESWNGKKCDGYCAVATQCKAIEEAQQSKSA